MTLGHAVTLALGQLVTLIAEQIVCVFGVNRTKCDTITKTWHVTIVWLSSPFCKIGQSKIKDGGHFPRWPRTNTF